MNLEMFTELLGNPEDKGSVLIKDPNIQQQIELSAWTSAILDVLVKNGLITTVKFNRLVEQYKKCIEEETKIQLQKQWDELSNKEDQ